MPPPVLDQSVGDGIGRGAVLRGRAIDALHHDRAPDFGRELVPHARHEIGRRGDADECGHARGPCQGREEHDPAAHAGADQDLRPLGQCVQRRDGILGPDADRAILEAAGGLAVPLVVEAQEGLAALAAEILQRHGLGAGHVRHEAAQEHDARAPPGAAVIGDCDALAPC